MPVEWQDGEGTVTINEVRWIAEEEFRKPDNGAFLAIDVTYEATEGTVSYNFFNWSAKDAEAREYNGSIGVVEPSLQSGDLPAGDKVRGWISFDVPKGETTVSLEDFLDDDLATWQIPAEL